MKPMKKMLFAVVMIVSLALSGCSQNGGGGEAKESVFRVALGGEPNYLDPALAGDAITNAVITQMYFPMFSYAANGELNEEAVESHTISEDGLVYTFKFREGNKWSDGKAVTAADYEFGMKRSIGYGPDASYAYFIYDYVVNAKEHYVKMSDVADMSNVGIKALDELTLEITLMQPTPFFTSLMTMNVFLAQRSDFAVEHASNWANRVDIPVNGAYKPTKINEKEEIVLAKNEHFIYADKVQTDSLVMMSMADMDAQLLAFQNGELDMALGAPADIVHSYKDKPELVIAQPFVINYYINLNGSKEFGHHPALQDVNVRRALALAINRKEILTVLDGGEAYYELNGFVPIGIPGKDGDFRTEADAQKKYLETNQEEAKRLLEAAGYGPSNPLALEYYYNSNTMHDTVAQVIQQQWAKVGINVTLKTGEIRTFFDDRSKGMYQLARNAMSADYMDPVNFLDLLKSSNQQKAVVNDLFYDDLLNQSQSELDRDKRMDILHQAEDYAVQEQVYIIPLFGYANAYLLKDGVTGIAYDPSGGTDFRFVKMPK